MYQIAIPVPCHSCDPLRVDTAVLQQHPHSFRAACRDVPNRAAKGHNRRAAGVALNGDGVGDEIKNPREHFSEFHQDRHRCHTIIKKQRRIFAGKNLDGKAFISEAGHHVPQCFLLDQAFAPKAQQYLFNVLQRSNLGGVLECTGRFSD